MPAIPDGYTRIGLALNPRQIARLRGISSRTGITQTTLLTACVDVLSDMEILEIVKRHAQVKVDVYTAKMLGQPYVGLV